MSDLNKVIRPIEEVAELGCLMMGACFSGSKLDWSLESFMAAVWGVEGFVWCCM